MTVNFRGQRSSDGQYSVEGTPEDAAAMVAFLRSDSARRAFRVDPKRIVIVGGSAGTYAALRATGQDPGLRCVGAIVPFNWTPAVLPARGDSAIRMQFDALLRSLASGPQPAIRAEGMVPKLLANAESYDLAAAGAALRDRKVLLIGAGQDRTAPLPVHFDPLVAAVRRAPGASLRDTLVDDAHNLPNTWQDVFAVLVRWLRYDCFP
jgi:acetyl esterase/lipase